MIVAYVVVVVLPMALAIAMAMLKIALENVVELPMKMIVEFVMEMEALVQDQIFQIGIWMVIAI